MTETCTSLRQAAFDKLASSAEAPGPGAHDVAAATTRVRPASPKYSFGHSERETGRPGTERALA